MFNKGVTFQSHHPQTSNLLCLVCMCVCIRYRTNPSPVLNGPRGYIIGDYHFKKQT